MTTRGFFISASSPFNFNPTLTIFPHLHPSTSIPHLLFFRIFTPQFQSNYRLKIILNPSIPHTYCFFRVFTLQIQSHTYPFFPRLHPSNSTPHLTLCFFRLTHHSYCFSAAPLSSPPPAPLTISSPPLTVLMSSCLSSSMFPMVVAWGCFMKMDFAGA